MNIADIYCEAVRVQEIIASGKSSLDDCLDADSRKEIRRTLGDLLFKLYRHRRNFDIFLDSHCRKKSDPGLRRLLYAALAQIWMRSGLAPEIAASGAVEAAKKLFGRSCGGFVNFLLRRAVASDMPAGPHLPEVLEKRWLDFWGAERVAELDRLFAESPAVRLTWRRRKEGAGVPDGGFVLEKDFAPGVEFFAAADAASALAGLKDDIDDHNVYIQDPATAFFTSFALPGKGDKVLDMCAAPGGKTLLLYDLVPDIHITACDRPGPRFRRMLKNFAGTSIKTVASDAAALAEDPAYCGRFDYILADLPCSNRGVFRSRPDALWRQQETIDENLAAVQKRLVSAAWQMLAAGGTLVVSTCSIDPEENDVLTELLRSNGADVSSHLLFPAPEHDGAWCCCAVKRRER